MNYSTILEESRRGGIGHDTLITLEKTSVASADWGKYKLKTVEIRTFTSETAARQAYNAAIHPRRARVKKNL